MASGREKRICWVDSTDRISELPQPLLHNILCFLSQKQAVQTCVLSKSWRYLGSTRPKLEFHYQDYYSNQPYFLSILDKTFHRYHDQKLCIQQFHVELSTTDPINVSFLQKWFPFIITAMGGVKTFDLSFRWPCSLFFDLPSAVFENSKSVRKLRLCGFRFSTMDKVHYNLKYLQTLTLYDVHIVDETFQNIMSSCRYIERVFLTRCQGLTTIRLMNNNCLKCFDLFDFQQCRLKEDLCFVNVPNLESMKMYGCFNWLNLDRQRNMYFPGLKSLELTRLQLRSARPSLDILSREFPCLQHFHIRQCGGFGELRVSSPSIKHLTISYLGKSIKVAVDAPNIEVLDYKSSLHTEISVATTSNEWKSNINPSSFNVRSEVGFLKLSKLLEAVSQSKIYLQLPHVWKVYDDSSDHEDDSNDNDYHDICGGGGYHKAVPVEYVHLDYGGHGFFNSEDFLNRMFRYCRPRNILVRECTHRSKLLCEILLFKHDYGIPYDWEQDLEEASMQVWDKNSEEWISVEGTAFLESDVDRSPSYGYTNDYSKHHEVWFKMEGIEIN